MIKDYIIGAAGGGGRKKGGGTKPSEAPNTLISKSEMSALFLLGEGEIEGAAIQGNIYMSTYLDGVPIQNTDGSFNFEGVKLAFRPGTVSQNYISGFSAVEAETQVGVQVKKRIGSVTRTINNAEVNAVRLRFTFPAMRKINTENNSTEPTSVSFRVEVRVNGGGWVERIRDTISGKATSPFERFYRLDLPPGSVWDIRVTRITDDSEQESLVNDIYWTSYTTVIDAKFRYPNSALLAIRIPAEHFRSMPQVSFRCKGKKVLIPNNYDPINRTYNGMWNGGFSYAWTNNPVWCLYDLLISSRYGCGDRLSANFIDKWSLYAIAQYCDERIASRRTGEAEPRFTFNHNITEPAEAYDLLNSIASNFRGSLYWSNGTVFAIQDRPAIPRKQFTKANVVELSDDNGVVTEPAFRYAHSGKSARHTVAIVRFTDKDNNFTPDLEVYEDYEGISQYGYNPIEIEAYGCTDRDQAYRTALWTVLTELNLTKTLKFKIGAEGAFLRPGDVMQISDPLRSGTRYGGRLAGYQDAEVLFLDNAPPNIAPGDKITINNAGGGLSEHTISVVNLSDPRGHVILIHPPLQQLPFSQAVWTISKANIKPQLFRMIAAVDKTTEDPSCYEISGLQYNDSIYNAVDFGHPLVFPPTQLQPPAVPNKPFKVQGVATPRFRDGRWIFDINVDWEEPLHFGERDPFTQSYEVELSNIGGGWGNFKKSSDPSTDYTTLGEDRYFVRVRAVDVLGRFSPWAESPEIILQRPIPPNPLGSVNKELTPGGGIVLTWSDTQHYPYGIVGYDIFLDGQLLQSLPLGRFYSGEIHKPPGVYNVEIKPRDFANSNSLFGLQTVLGSEYAPKNPFGEMSVELQDNGTVQLHWTDITSHNKDFKGYRVRRNGELIEETPNKFSMPFSVVAGQNYTLRIYAVNFQGYESLGYLEFFLGADAGAASIPNPAGTITKESSPDGGIILRWTDNQTYKNFGGYRVYINGELAGETVIKAFPSIIRPPDDYTVTIKAKNKSGLQSLGGLTVQLTAEDYIPPAPAFLLVQQSLNGSKQFYWSVPEQMPRDVVLFRIKYNVGVNFNWDNAHFLQDLPIAQDRYETLLFRQGTYTILIKMVDVTGYESIDFVFTEVNLSDPVPDNVVELWDFRTPADSDTGQTDFGSKLTWTGASMNLTVNTEGDLVVTDPSKDAYYDSSFEVTSRGHLKASETVQGNYALYYERVTQGILWADDTATIWSDTNENEVLWKQFDKYLGFPVAVAVDQEEYKVRVHIKPGGGKIQQLKVYVDAPDILEVFNDFQIDSTGTRIVPRKPMNVLKAVNLTLQDPANNAAVLLAVVDKDPVNGALVEAYDTAGARTPALVDAVLVGY